MRSRLLTLTTLLLLVAVPAAAQEPPPAAPPADPACTDDVTRDRALRALQKAIEKPLPARANRAIKVRFTPCAPREVLLRVRHASSGGTLLASANRTLRTTGTVTVNVRTTKAVERLRGKRLRLFTRVVVRPAA